MARTILLASNDIIMREIVGKFFHAHGFLCPCVNFDDKLLSHIHTFSPLVLISELVLRSRFFSPHDIESSITLLLAARCRAPRMPIMLLGHECPQSATNIFQAAGISDFFPHPPDLVQMLSRVRVELRRIARLKNPGSGWTSVATPAHPFFRKRGRPRKYPLPAERAAAIVAATLPPAAAAI